MNKETIFPHGTHMIVMMAMYGLGEKCAAMEVRKAVVTATGTELSRPHVHKTMNELANRGFVEKGPAGIPGDDRRRFAYALTESGRELVEWLGESVVNLGAVQIAAAAKARRGGSKGPGPGEHKGRGAAWRERPPCLATVPAVAAE